MINPEFRRNLWLELSPQRLVLMVSVLGIIAALTVYLGNDLDPIIAICVALNILREGWLLIHRSSQGLMDSSASPEVNQLIHDTLKHFEARQPSAKGLPRVSFDHIRTRAAGQRNFVSMHLHLPASCTLGSTAELRNQVEQALIAAVPTLHATIELMPDHMEPICPPFNAPLHGTKAEPSTPDSTAT